MKVLSLFDGMACGMLAMQAAGIDVDRYVAFEIDKYAVQTSTHNSPMIEHRGDVFKADFTEFRGFDFLVGGSPCTYWSIAQKNNRETEASGMGWELFSQYVRALKEAQPMYFIYENNKSMANAIRESITETFGFEAVHINSALVSAQNRQRLYWVGMRNPDGTYSKVQVDQPEDRGILLRDILDGYIRIPEYGDGDKSMPLNAYYPNNCGGWWLKVFSDNPNKQQVDMIAQPVGIGYRGRMEDGKWVKRFESNGESKANALTTAQTDSMVAEPIRIGTFPRSDGVAIDHQQSRIYSIDGKSTNINANGGGQGAKTGLYAVPVLSEREVDYMFRKEGRTEYGYIQNTNRDKAQCITANISKGVPYNVLFEEVDGALYLIDDGENIPVYKVKNGMITIKSKQYPIKLVDGYYIIRKLTVTECMRLQTVPEWYEFPVSDSQAYKMLGNGWTVEVIAHLINATQAAEVLANERD